MSVKIANISPVMFTDEQMRSAATNLCALRGLEADMGIQLPADAAFINRVPEQAGVFVPRWTLCAQEVERFIHIHMAIYHAVGSETIQNLNFDQLEKAGRELARLRNVEIDSPIQVPLDSTLSPWRDQNLKEVKRWELYAEEIKNFLLIHEAIQRVGVDA